jgi:hypothetical protein
MMIGSIIVYLTRLRVLLGYLTSPFCTGSVCLGMVAVMWWAGGPPAISQARFTTVLVSVVKDKVMRWLFKETNGCRALNRPATPFWLRRLDGR